MAFGQELKDFVSGFTTGYNLIKSPEEKEWEREERQMKRENHQWGREGDLDNRRHRNERARESDRRWGVEDDWRRRQSGKEEERWLWEQEQEERKWLREGEDRKLKMREGTGGAIPDDVDEFEVQGGASFQPASYGGGEPRTGTQVARALVRDLERDFGLSRDIAIGVVGELAAESGGFTKLQEINPVVKGSRGGYGYAQWTADRRKAFEGFVGDKAPLDSYAANYNYLKHELQNTPEGRVLEKLQRARNSDEAGRMFTDTFLRPGVPNHEGRTKWRRRVEGLFGGDRPAVNAARGGMIEAIPTGMEMEDEEDQGVLPEEPPVETAQVLPEEGPMPSRRPQYEGVEDEADDAPTDDPYETGRRAVREGLKRAISSAEADVQGAVQDPEMEKYRERYLRGYGAAPQQVVKQMMDKIDPERKMSPTERNVLAYANTYRFFWERGEPEKAKEAAASLVQFHRKAAQQYLALGQIAAQEGDLDAAAQAAVKAYANIPNGRDMQIKPVEGGYEISVTDIKTGKQVTKQVVPPNEFAAAAAGFNPSTFDDEIMNAAGVAPESTESATPTQREEMAANVGALAEERMPDADERERGAIRDVAMEITSINGNNIDSDRALRLAEELVRPEFSFNVKNDRGNPGYVAVTTQDGLTIRLRAGELNRLKEIRQRNIDAAKQQENKAAESEAWRNDVGATAGKFLESLTGAVKEGWERESQMVREGRSSRAIPEEEPVEPPAEGEVERLKAARAEIIQGDRAGRADELRQIEGRLRELGAM